MTGNWRSIKKATWLAGTCLLAVLFPAGASQADGEFEIDSGDFLAHAFTDGEPASGTVWLSGEIRQAATEILGHAPAYLRVRYWGGPDRSAWIIDEIGKTEPITFGIIVSAGHIESAQVLVFRESRGWEIRHEFFTRQYLGLKLGSQGDLTGRINGISGATLSVRAMNKVARLALYLAGTLDQQSS